MQLLCTQNYNLDNHDYLSAMFSVLHHATWLVVEGAGTKVIYHCSEHHRTKGEMQQVLLSSAQDECTSLRWR